MRKRTIVILSAVVVLFAAAAAGYIGIGRYYQDHFFEHTTVNGLDISDLTVSEAEALVAEQVEDYQITVRTREGNTEVIQGADIGYQFVSGGEIEGFLELQNRFAWLPALFGSWQSYQMEASVTSDEVLMREAADQMACMQEANVTKPQDAYLDVQDGNYVVVPEVQGNELDQGKVYDVLREAIANNETEVDLEALDCYRKPSITSEDEALNAEASVRNRYSSLSVTYQLGGGVTEVLDSETIASWFSLDEEQNPVFDRTAVAAWVNQLADQYDTIGTWPPFVTSNGETVWVEARTYGWQIDRESETEALYQILLSGDSAQREPVWYETAWTRGENDIGNTYVEIDYTNQRMWYYKDGVLLVETSVVTGNVSQGMSSPEGIFCLVGKEQNAVLKGEGYETPVSYWMPFYGGVGIHDADSWRTSYGGTIYQYSGSHGCINTPTAQAAILFENIEIGTPIICYSSSVNYGYGETETSGGQTDDTQNVSGQTTDSAQGDGTVTDDTIVILDGGGTGDEEDWADESLYYGTNDGVIIDDVIVLPDTTGQ
jgi:hypothetical protein